MARFEGIITPMVTPFNRDEGQTKIGRAHV